MSLELRKRLKDDFAFYAYNAIKIRTKAGEIKPLNLNKVQRELLKVIEAQEKATGKVRVIVLKARQQGLSTLTSNFLYFKLSQSMAKKGLIVAHQGETTKSIFGMIQHAHRHCPDWLKPSTSYSGRKELVFDKLNTAFMIASAGGEGVGRGETITHCMLSEVAFWKPNVAEETWNGLVPSIPSTPDTAIIIESTANGYNLFKDLWDGANAKGGAWNGFIPFFAPWFWSDEYQEDPGEGFERTLEEMDLVEAHGLTDRQLAWRRSKIAAIGQDKFEQEFPATADEAFKASGRPVFDPDQLQQQLDRISEQEGGGYPLDTETLDPADNTTFVSHPIGELSIYHEHDPGQVYTIGADVALGIPGGDYSVAQVLDGDRRQVAVWRGHADPIHFATILNALGRKYTGQRGFPARLAVESNNHGYATGVALKRLQYPNLYTVVNTADLDDKHTETIGYRMTSRSKKEAIASLIAALREGTITLEDRTTVDEMFTYAVGPNGEMEAQNGRHDDCVMSLAIANYVHEARAEPIVVTDDWYFEAF